MTNWMPKPISVSYLPIFFYIPLQCSCAGQEIYSNIWNSYPRD